MLNILTLPAATDMHVHLRDPGQTYKTDIREGSSIAARSGIAAVACMPNTVPVIDTADKIVRLTDRMTREAACEVLIVAAVTLGQRGEQLTDFAALKAAGAVAFSDDGLPIYDDTLMERALIEAKHVGLPLIDHSEPEVAQIERDIYLVEKTGCPIHIAHVSLADSLTLIRAAKAKGLPVTCEVAPHHFWFTQDIVAEIGGNARMAPPLAAQTDIDAVILALQNGTIDAIASDHAPHHAVEKARENPPNGIIGLETLWPATLTALYFTGVLTMERIVDLLCHAPRRILNLPPQCQTIQIDLDETRMYQPMGRCTNTPFAGVELRGWVV